MLIYKDIPKDIWQHEIFDCLGFRSQIKLIQVNSYFNRFYITDLISETTDIIPKITKQILKHWRYCLLYTSDAADE